MYQPIVYYFGAQVGLQCCWLLPLTDEGSTVPTAPFLFSVLEQLAVELKGPHFEGVQYLRLTCRRWTQGRSTFLPS